MRGKLIYKNWLAELGFDPTSKSGPRLSPKQQLKTVSLEYPKIRAALMTPISPGRQEQERIDLIRAAVADAISRLPLDQREFIERHYYMGQSYTDMARETGRAKWRFESLHRRALKSLRKRLEPFVLTQYGVDAAKQRFCPVCASARRAEIDQLLRTRDRRATWKSILRHVRTDFGLKIRRPQTLIAHEKYH